MGRRAVVASCLALILLAPAAVAAGPPTVELTVVSPNLRFGDGTLRGSFTSSGICLPSRVPAVVAEPCADSGPESQGIVRGARLGFHVARDVEAISENVPVAETSLAKAPEQLVLVGVDVLEAGTLTVEVTGRVEGGWSPEPVAGSASPGGTIDGRSVNWQVEDAQPGLLEFRVRFRPNPSDPTSATFVPEVGVTRESESRLAIPALGGGVEAPIPVRRIATLVLSQRVPPAYGPPTAAVEDFTVLRGTNGVPDNFLGSISMSAQGAYQASASGVVSGGTGDVMLTDLAPGVAQLANVGFTNSTNLYVTGQAKADTTGGWLVNEAGNVSGARFGITTAAPGGGEQGNPLAVPTARPLAGTWWDGDTTAVAVDAGIGKVSIDGVGSGANTGHLVLDWNGQVAHTGVWTQANATPFTESNGTNPSPPYQDALDPLQSARYARMSWTEAFTTSATVPTMAVGGDVDNRGGTGTVMSADSVRVDVPPGNYFVTGQVSTFHPTVSKFRMEVGFDDKGVTLTPSIQANGYLLESSNRGGYDRDWSPVTVVHEVSIRDEQDSVATRTNSLATVPLGTRCTIVAFAGGEVSRLVIRSGTWSVTTTAKGIDAVRLR